MFGGDNMNGYIYMPTEPELGEEWPEELKLAI